MSFRAFLAGGLMVVMVSGCETGNKRRLFSRKSAADPAPQVAKEAQPAGKASTDNQAAQADAARIAGLLAKLVEGTPSDEAAAVTSAESAVAQAELVDEQIEKGVAQVARLSEPTPLPSNDAAFAELRRELDHDIVDDSVDLEIAVSDNASSQLPQEPSEGEFDLETPQIPNAAVPSEPSAWELESAEPRESHNGEAIVQQTSYETAAPSAANPLPDVVLGKAIHKDENVQEIAIQAVIAHEEHRGWSVSRVQSSDSGFQLVSRRPHPLDPQTFTEVRFIMVDGHTQKGPLTVTDEQFQANQRLTDDFWVYCVFNCDVDPVVHAIRNPIKLGLKPVVKVERYQLDAGDISQMAEEHRPRLENRGNQPSPF